VWAISVSQDRRSTSDRSRGGVAAHATCAAAAASQARRASAGVPSATSAKFSPVDGSATAMLADPVIQRPPTNISVRMRPTLVAS
jgi:hypothetical protein